MANGWTPERKARQAAAIRAWKPWEHSTGPKTEAGKAKSALNGDKGAEWREVREELRMLRDVLRAHRQALRDIGN